MNTKVINLFGGPGIGKTKAMLEIASRMKSHGILLEIAPEYAKTAVWEGNLEMLKDQLTIYAMQYRSINRLYGKVEYVVTDSPLLLSNIYGKLNDKLLPSSFYDLVVDTHKMFDSIDIILPRDPSIKYEVEGRVHSYEESIKIDELISNEVISNLGSHDLVSKSTYPEVLTWITSHIID